MSATALARTDSTQRPQSRLASCPLSGAEFDRVRALVKRQTGISLCDAKRQMVYRRLVRRVQDMNFSGFDEYCDYVESGDAAELERFVNAVTTNLTAFFREDHHFDFLAQTVLPEILRNKKERRLRIWSAGCSTGEEPYSIACVLKELLPPGQQWDARILATDLDTNVLAKCRDGIYARDAVAKLPSARLNKWFQKGNAGNEDSVRACDELRKIVTFKQLNLLSAWPMKGPFDVIFCRNVIIYFDKETQISLIDRYADILDDSGYLFIGHSETLYKVSERFRLTEKTTYRKLTGV